MYYGDISLLICGPTPGLFKIVNSVFIPTLMTSDTSHGSLLTVKFQIRFL